MPGMLLDTRVNSVLLKKRALYIYFLFLYESAKLRGSRATVPSCLRVSENFSRGYFVGLKFLFVGISWVLIFSCGYFLGLELFLVGILWVQDFMISNKLQ